MQRKKFIQTAATAFLLLSNGKILNAHDLLSTELAKRKSKFRFAVASDGHYGQPETAYEEYFSTIVSRMNDEHKKNPFSFCVINGDIVHDEKVHFPAAKKALDKLLMKYYVSQGNHDHLTADEWELTWKMPVNLDFTMDDHSFLIGTTATPEGKYICPNISWFRQKLDEHKNQKNVFIFIHINPGKMSTHAVDCPDFFELLAKHKNVRAIFNGHDHDEEGIKTKNNIPFIYDAHFGGNWGTAYRGFRVVELLDDNSILTYIMNPWEKINTATLS